MMVMKSWGIDSPLRIIKMAFFIASILATTSLDSKACLISLAMAGVALSKWMRRLHDLSIDGCRDGDVAGQTLEEGRGRSRHTVFGGGRPKVGIRKSGEQS